MVGSERGSDVDWLDLKEIGMWMVGFKVCTRACMRLQNCMYARAVGMGCGW